MLSHLYHRAIITLALALALGATAQGQGLPYLITYYGAYDYSHTSGGGEAAAQVNEVWGAGNSAAVSAGSVYTIFGGNNNFSGVINVICGQYNTLGGQYSAALGYNDNDGGFAHVNLIGQGLTATAANQTWISGKIFGNGNGLTNLPGTVLVSPISPTNLPTGVLTNGDTRTIGILGPVTFSNTFIATGGGALIDDDQIPALDWTARHLSNSTPQLILDWENGLLLSTVVPGASVDWNVNQALNGNWTDNGNFNVTNQLTATKFTNASQTFGVDATGKVTAATYVGSGGGLTGLINLNATQLTSGTVPNSALGNAVITNGAGQATIPEYSGTTYTWVPIPSGGGGQSFNPSQFDTNGIGQPNGTGSVEIKSGAPVTNLNLWGETNQGITVWSNGNYTYTAGLTGISNVMTNGTTITTNIDSTNGDNVTIQNGVIIDLSPTNGISISNNIAGVQTREFVVGTNGVGAFLSSLTVVNGSKVLYNASTPVNGYLVQANGAIGNTLANGILASQVATNYGNLVTANTNILIAGSATASAGQFATVASGWTNNTGTNAVYLYNGTSGNAVLWWCGGLAGVNPCATAVITDTVVASGGNFPVPQGCGVQITSGVGITATVVFKP